MKLQMFTDETRCSLQMHDDGSKDIFLCESDQQLDCIASTCERNSVAQEQTEQALNGCVSITVMAIKPIKRNWSAVI